MAARPIKRTVSVRGIDGVVNVVIDVERGISFSAKGSRKHTELSWEKAVASSQTPYDVKSFLAGDAKALLVYEANKIAARKKDKV